MTAPTIHRLGRDDLDRFTAVIRLFEAEFGMAGFRLPPPAHLQSCLEDPHFWVFAALRAGQVVGGLTAYVLRQYYVERPLVYVYDLAVATAWQRQGIGQHLMTAVQEAAREAGCEEVFVQADQDEPHALGFYRSTRPTEEEAVAHFYYVLHPPPYHFKPSGKTSG